MESRPGVIRCGNGWAVVRWTSITVVVGAVVAGVLPPFAALVCGVVIASVCGAPARAGSAARRLLAASVVAYGCGLELGTVLLAGCDGLGVTLLMLAWTFSIGWMLSRWLRIPADVSLLITAGTAICGGSAIAAVAPLIRARTPDIAAAVSVVFVLNAVALLAFPVVGRALELDADAFGQWCALAIHDTSSVVGAAATHGNEALEVAVVTKLTRALWIVPIGLLIARVRARAAGEPPRGRPAVPLFLVAFLVAAGLHSIAPSLRPLGLAIAHWAPAGMSLALFAIGLGLVGALSLRSVGRALGFGSMLWLVLSVTALACVG